MQVVEQGGHQCPCNAGWKPGGERAHWPEVKVRAGMKVGVAADRRMVSEPRKPRGSLMVLPRKRWSYGGRDQSTNWPKPGARSQGSWALGGTGVVMSAGSAGDVKTQEPAWNAGSSVAVKTRFAHMCFVIVPMTTPPVFYNLHLRMTLTPLCPGDLQWYRRPFIYIPLFAILLKVIIIYWR